MKQGEISLLVLVQFVVLFSSFERVEVLILWLWLVLASAFAASLHRYYKSNMLLGQLWILSLLVGSVMGSVPTNPWSVSPSNDTSVFLE